MRGMKSWMASKTNRVTPLSVSVAVAQQFINGDRTFELATQDREPATVDTVAGVGVKAGQGVPRRSRSGMMGMVIIEVEHETREGPRQPGQRPD